MRTVRRRLVHPLATLLAATALTLAGARPAAATAESYVALGDSFAAGVGARSYQAESLTCYRSPQSYPALVAARAGLPLTFAACAGAVTADVVERQALSLQRSTTFVTVTIGGNDLGFASVLSTCALPGWLGSCGPATDRARALLRSALPERLDRVFAVVRARSPRARVVVTGYPRLFGEKDCSALTFFSRSERRRLNQTTEELDATIRARARAAGFRYVGPAAAFTGHAWCADDAWVNGPSRPTVNSFHPTAGGHAAYARLVGPALLRRGPAAATRTATAPAVRLVSGLSARGDFAFTVPDLGSAAVTRAAARAGITATELARLRRAQQRGASHDVVDRLDAELTRRAAARRGGNARPGERAR